MIILVTVKDPKNSAHNPHDKKSGVCKWSSYCTDMTGEHHTFFVHPEQFGVKEINSKEDFLRVIQNIREHYKKRGVHVTRIEVPDVG